MKLLPFQESGAEFLASRYHAALGDDPGLGKTVQAIAAAERLKLRSVLVICPASVRSSWREHVRRSPVGFTIISYNEAVALSQAGNVGNFDAAIPDEVHFCKTLNSQRTLAVFGKRGLLRRARHIWPLSGTLIPNGRPVEIYPMLKTLAPAFQEMTYAAYTQRFCNAYFDGREMNVKGASRLDEFSGLLRGFMLRRTKREVFPHRKEPLVTCVPIDLSAVQLAAVRAAEDEIGGRAARLSPAAEAYSQLGDTARLLRLLGEAMVPAAAAFVQDKLAWVDKVAVFFQHSYVGAQLAERLRLYGPVVYEGGMSDTEKDAVKRRFVQEATCRVFIGQRQAAGTGINDLQRVCSTVVVAEPRWVPGDTEQLISRFDRMGQEDDLVNAYVMYARGTLSSVVVQVHDRKDANVERVMGEAAGHRAVLGDLA